MIRVLLFFCLILSCKGPEVKSPETVAEADSLPIVGNTSTGPRAKEFMLAADSVIIISHLYSYNTQTDIVTSLFKENGQLDESTIQERKALNRSDILALTAILDTVNEGESSPLNCFEPHHSILAYTSKKLSSIDICFHCKKLNADGFPFGTKMNDDKFEKLKIFFKNMGFHYKL